MVYVTKEAQGITFKVVARIHNHGVEDEAIKQNDNRYEDPQDQGNSIPEIGIKVVFIDISRVVSLKDRQQLQKGSHRGICLIENGDQV